jgi:hypothetical protein
MKLKQLFLAIFVTSVLFVSCTKEDVYDPIKISSTVTTESLTMKTMATTATVRPKAYIFVEPYSMYKMVSSYLKTVPKSPSYSLPFIGWFGVNGLAWKYNFINYVDMPHWYDGRLPSVIESEIPQTSGGVDTYGNAVVAYNFKTVVIPKNTTVGLAYISILVPVSELSNDTKRLRTVYTYEKVGNTVVSNGSISGWVYTMDNVIYNETFNYQGNRIPKGIYRLYTTTSLRVNLTSTKDYYLKGNSTININ